MKLKKLSSSYSVLWILMAVFLILIPIINPYIVSIATYFGIHDEFLIYLLIICFLLVYLLYITSKVVRLNNQVKELISNSAILEDEIKELREKKLN